MKSVIGSAKFQEAEMAIALGKTISNETLLLIWLKCPTC
jgi:hypothetical protein